MGAPPKPDYPLFAPDDLTKYDAFVFGVPTRYGSFPAQWKVIPDLPRRLLDKITDADSRICHRLSGMPLADSGPRVLSVESTPVSSFPPVPLVEARK